MNRWAEIFGRRAVTNSAWLGGASLATGLLGAATSALLGRTLGVEGFGALALLVSLMNLLTDAGDLGLTSAFVRYGAEARQAGDTRRFDAVVAALVRLKLAALVIVGIVGFVFFVPLLNLLSSSVAGTLSGFAPVAMLVVLIGIAASVYYPVFQAHRAFKPYALASVARGALKLAVVAVMAGFLAGGLTIGGALWAEAASAGGFLILCVAASPQRRLRPGPVDPAITKALIGFTGWFSLYQVIMLFGSRVDVLMTAGLTNEHVLGQYSAAQKISALVVAATNAYYTVLLAEAAATGGGERLRGVIRQGRSAVLLLAAGMGILALLAGPIIAILYGSAFTEAASVLAWMCPGLAFLVLAYPVNAVLYVRNRVAVFPLTAALSLVVSVGANLLLLPAFGARGAAMAYSLTALSALLVPLGYSIAKRSSMLWKEGGGTRP